MLTSGTRRRPHDHPLLGCFAHARHTGRRGHIQQVGGTRFLPAVEGMRACAAVGVVVTHVAFQTGHTGGVAGRLFGRFDLAVAVFFALSGFLLWRGTPPRRAVCGPSRRPGTTCGPASCASCPPTGGRRGDPDAAARGKADPRCGWPTCRSPRSMPLTLTAGLTQMWSLSVEVSFYLALPLLALLVRRVPVRARSR